MGEVAKLADRVLLEAAVEYVKMGWHVAPVYTVTDGVCSCKLGAKCGSPGKHPNMPAGYKPASTEEEVKALWQRAPGSNIAVYPGLSGMIVLDIDPRNGGDESLRDLEAKHQLPETPMSHTGGGGWHYFFLKPEGATELKTGVLDAGLEVKASTGYIVAPPSVHYSGKTYSWDVGQHIEDIPLAVLPSWLYRMIGRQEKKPEYDMECDPAGPIAGLMGQLFHMRRMVKARVGIDKIAVECPWQEEHSNSSDEKDTSTIVFAPRRGTKWGWFHCSHAHCANRTQLEVLDSFPRAWLDEAREKLMMDPGALPGTRLPPAQVSNGQRKNKGKRAESTSQAWEAACRYDANGKLTKDPGNAALILANSPEWFQTLRLEAMSGVIEWWAEPPVIPGLAAPVVGEHLSEADYLYVQHWFAKQYGVGFGRDVIRNAVAAAAKANQFDKLVEYLTGLKWDGVERVERWTHTYLGATDTDYNRFIGRSWLVSAVARAMSPGCQADHVMVLEGPQGVGKSSALAALAGDWFLPELPSVQAKDAVIVLEGTWIANIEELAGITNHGWEKVKAFITQREDVFRRPYEAVRTSKPRRCVFAACTNRSDYATDETGNRRFWPVKCGRMDVPALARDRDQLWAEALVLYDQGAAWHPDPGMAQILAAEVKLRGEDDPWLEMLLALVVTDPGRTWTSREALAALGVDVARASRKETMRVGRCFKRLYYTRQTAHGITMWIPPEAPPGVALIQAARERKRKADIGA